MLLHADKAYRNFSIALNYDFGFGVNTLLTPLTRVPLREQGIKLKSEWIRAVQTRSIGNSANTVQGPYVLLWRGKLYTFRDVLQ